MGIRHRTDIKHYIDRVRRGEDSGRVVKDLTESSLYEPDNYYDLDEEELDEFLKGIRDKIGKAGKWVGQKAKSAAAGAWKGVRSAGRGVKRGAKLAGRKSLRGIEIAGGATSRGATRLRRGAKKVRQAHFRKEDIMNLLSNPLAESAVLDIANYIYERGYDRTEAAEVATEMVLSRSDRELIGILDEYEMDESMFSDVADFLSESDLYYEYRD